MQRTEQSVMQLGAIFSVPVLLTALAACQGHSTAGLTLRLPSDVIALRMQYEAATRPPIGLTVVLYGDLPSVKVRHLALDITGVSHL